MILFQPAQLLAMGAIGKHGLHIAAYRLFYQPMGSIKDRIRALESRNFRSRIINEARPDILNNRQLPGILLSFQHCPFHLYIAETIIRETGMPSLLPLSFQGIFIVMLPACLPLVASAFLRQRFGYKQCDLLSFLSTDGYLRKSCQVLSHVQDKGGCVYSTFGRLAGRGYLFGSQPGYFPDAIVFHDFNRLCHLRAEHSFRSFLYHYGTPCVISKSRFVPVLLFAACVIVFAAIDAIKYYRTEIVFPVFIGNDGFGAAIFIVHHQAEA